jgi:hypothetical protein
MILNENRSTTRTVSARHYDRNRQFLSRVLKIMLKLLIVKLTRSIWAYNHVNLGLDNFVREVIKLIKEDI